ncbi:uncharacterized protein LOC110853868 [Folsomia candida]|uniref:Uncharacterized protein n=1 Tax=Folsomia candida TaxID=158441 RepID=A0A226DZY0_FOLCA|nr:uncharacterized protein LOC110853868 [Folsomia candida]OXA50277.1 hypothetical protein Fcan01_14735 [Folsomia candida]
MNPDLNKSSLPVLLLLVSFVLISEATIPPTEPFEVRLYNKLHFEGRYIKLKIGLEQELCINLPPVWEKKISSVDPLGCVILYAESDCKGLRRRLERWSWGSSSLKDISFENMIVSVGPCPLVKKLLMEEL